MDVGVGQMHAVVYNVKEVGREKIKIRTFNRACKFEEKVLESQGIEKDSKSMPKSEGIRNWRKQSMGNKRKILS